MSTVIRIFSVIIAVAAYDIAIGELPLNVPQPFGYGIVVLGPYAVAIIASLAVGTWKKSSTTLAKLAVSLTCLVAPPIVYAAYVYFNCVFRHACL